jgi:nucleotide-binding universal stress UspA family protein
MTILCATDFSPCSDAAVRLATAMARRRGARLVLLHTIETPASPEVVVGPSDLDWHSLAAAEAALGRQAGDLGKAGLDVEVRVLFGDPSLHIVETARELDAELVVVGTHGRKGVAHFLMGSVAEYVVRTCSCPVLVAPAGAVDLLRWEGTGALRLVLGADGSARSEAAFSWVGKLAQTGAFDLALVWVYWPPDEAERYGLETSGTDHQGGPDLLGLLERDVVEQARPLVGERPLRIHFRAAEHDAEAALVEEARQLQADAIVVGTSRHRPGGHTALAATAVLRASPLPVFCVPEQAVPARKSLPQVRSILVATDLSDASRNVIRTAYGLLRPAGGRVELCTVHERGGPAHSLKEIPLRPLDEAERATLEAQLAASIPPEAASHGIETQVSVIEGTTAANAIVKAAERLNVDLVAVGSHGRSGLGRLLLGSVAEEVARRSRRGVLIARDRTH